MAFRSGRSCLTNLLDYLEYVTKNVDQGKPVDCIYLDFSKAFDKVPHERLLLKLKSYGIDGKLFLWIKNWILGRKQRVILNGSASQWQPVQSGVPKCPCLVHFFLFCRLMILMLVLNLI